MIMLADFAFAAGRSDEGRDRIEQFRASCGPVLTPDQASNLARLLSRSGDESAAKRVHTNSIIEASRRHRDHADDLERDEFELLLVRYLTEYGYFLARRSGRHDDELAANFLKSQLGELSTPPAIARLSGRIADHYNAAGKFDSSRQFLDQAENLVAADESARRWIECCRLRVGISESYVRQNQRWQAKRGRISNLRQELDALLELRNPSQDSQTRIDQLQEQLELLATTP